MLWFQGRPRRRVPRVIGFLDADNMFIQEERPFSPSAWSTKGVSIEWIKWVLDNALVVLRNIAERPVLRLFINLDSRHPNARREEIAEAVRERGIELIHVDPDALGKDCVDAALIADWQATEKEAPTGIPFVLFSEDAGFAPLLQATRRRGRKVYVFLPTNHFYPNHVTEANGWGWINPDAYRDRALSFLLNPHAPRPKRHFIEQMVVHYPEAAQWWLDAWLALDALEAEPERSFDDDTACVAYLIEHGIDPERAKTLLWYLVWYDAIRLQDGKLQRDPSYVRRTLPLSSE